MSQFNEESGLPHPASFALGSAESRAAARALAQHLDRVDIRIIVNAPRPGGRRHQHRFVAPDGKVWEIIIPRKGDPAAFANGVDAEISRPDSPLKTSGSGQYECGRVGRGNLRY